MILENPIFTEMILPFLLVFVVVFAILQKSKILGEGKEQIDAITALVIGLILVGVPGPRDLIVGIMPWLAVAVAVILMFLIIYGFVAGDLNDDKNFKPKWKQGFAVVAVIFVLGVVAVVSGLWGVVWGWLSIGESSEIWMSVLMLAVIIGVVALAVNSAKDRE